MKVRLISLASLILTACSTPQRDVTSSDAPVAVLRQFLAKLAEDDYEGAYRFIAPSSKETGDPVCYHTPLDYKSFLAEVRPRPAERFSEGQSTVPEPSKFSRYALGAHRWEGRDRFLIWLYFGVEQPSQWRAGDRDEALLTFEHGHWYVADPVHIIR